MTRGDFIYDVRHGGPRRILNATLRDFVAAGHASDLVLEIGCGHYDHRPFFSQPIVRLDFDPAHEPCVAGDIHTMPIRGDAFDVVLAMSVLEHVHDPYAATREIYRIVRPGGQVLAWVPFFFGVHGFPGDISRFTEEGLRVLFERAGFEIVRSDAAKYAGLFLNLNDAVNTVLSKQSGRRTVRWARWVLGRLTRLGFPLDRRLKLRTLYAGTELIARKPLAAHAPRLSTGGSTSS